MSNEYGQIGQSSLGETVDLLLDALTLYAYGPYEHPGEPPAVVDGLKVAQKVRSNPQHQVNTSGISVANPAFAAEKAAFEKSLWRQLKRGYERLRAMDNGLCLKCWCENDQRHNRYCSRCERKVQERITDA